MVLEAARAVRALADTTMPVDGSMVLAVALPAVMNAIEPS